jgi:hypothetical protein
MNKGLWAESLVWLSQVPFEWRRAAKESKYGYPFFFGATRGRHCTNERRSTWKVQELFG